MFLYSIIFIIISMLCPCVLVASDDEILELCTAYNDFDKNKPRIIELLERPGYNINAELDSHDCGSMTLLHATFMFHRNINSNNNPIAKEGLYNIMQLLLDYKANPHIVTKDCTFLDEVMNTAFCRTINSTYKHVQISSDTKIMELLKKYYPSTPQYDPIYDVKIWMFDNLLLIYNMPPDKDSSALESQQPIHQYIDALKEKLQQATIKVKNRYAKKQ